MNQTRPPPNIINAADGATTSSSPVHAAPPHLFADSPLRNPPVATAPAALSQSPPSDVTSFAYANTTPAAENGRKRRASGAPGSRGVANLNPEQLAKKRANDREAQRAIRERTKNTIDTLERRIAELQSQQPFQDLQRALAERDKARAECKELRKRLNIVANLAAGGDSPELGELAVLTVPRNNMSSFQHHAPQHVHVPSYQSHVSLQDHTTLQSPALQSPHGSNGWSPNRHPAASVPVYHATDPRRWPAGLDQSPYQHTLSPIMYEPQRQLQHQTSGERLGLNFLLDTTQTRKSSGSGSATMSYSSPASHEQPLFSRIPMLSSPSCPLDALLTDFIQVHRRQLEAGVPASEVIGPKYPSLVAFHDKSTSHRPSCHPISAMLIDVLSKFPDIYALPEQVAVLYIMFVIIRWLIYPSRECYEDLPEWCRPTAEQLERSHAIWVDHLPWPFMRRQLVARLVPFEEFFVPYTTTVSINWPYGRDQVLVATPLASPDDPSAVKMTAGFEAHLRDLRNWSLGTKFKQTFPQLVDDSVRIVDKDRS
ncbi:Hypothetical protein R9X50_00306400 [Acrodontium crateriforme]|uniref:BZIP transcription factor n=1 Tax=Acrodontium crateriforme TaxID=150365 RepID=A0AAQ3R957_9PEZI|nr:Hypothetical protein R9X50_00306400 [Acrodontium crateriforme]